MFGDLVVNLVARVNQFTAPMAAARRVLTGFSQSATSASSGVSRAVSSIAGAFGRMSGIGGIVGGAAASLTVMGALTWGGSMAVEAEKAQIAFATMLKSPAAAKILLEDLSRFAAETPYESPEVTAAAKQLLAYGTGATQIIPTLRMLGDVASGVGMPLGELAYLFGTATVQGRLFAKDINQFTGRGIPIIQALADVMGVAQGEVMKMVEAGQVTSKEMTAAFEHMTQSGGQFEGMMAAQSQTTSGLWSTLKDNIGLALRDISAALMQGFDIKGLFGDANTFAADFRANIETWIPIFLQIGATTREWLTWIITAAGDLYKALAFTFANFGELASLTLTQVGLYFITLGNDIAHFFTGILPAALMAFANYAKSLMGTLLDNVAGKMADVKAMMTGGKATHEWKALGDVKIEMVTPQRQRSELEKSLEETIAKKQERLGGALAANEEVFAPKPQVRAAKVGPLFFDDDEKAAARQFAEQTGERNANAALAKKQDKVNAKWAGLDAKSIHEKRKEYEQAWNAMTPQEKLMEIQRRPWAAAGKEDEISRIAMKESAKQPEKFKLSGALAAGSKDAYSAIVNSMYRTGGQSPQDKALNIQKENLRASKDVAANILGLRDDVKRNNIAIVRDLDK